VIRLITLAKKNPESVSAKRQAFQKLCDRTVVKSLFDAIGPLYKDINGGYTRIMACGNRRGDGAEMAIIELTKRTISDDDLLGRDKATADKKNKTKTSKKSGAKADDKKEKTAAAPDDVSAGEKEKRFVEDVKKEKAKKEQRKVADKGLFKRFRRKSIG